MEQQLFQGASFNVYIGSSGAPYGLIKYPDLMSEYYSLLFMAEINPYSILKILVGLAVHNIIHSYKTFMLLGEIML